MPIPAAVRAPTTRRTSVGVATPTVSEIDSSSTPSRSSRSATLTTAASLTSPSYGQPNAVLT